ncbi:MAG: M48 family metallopeptidase [Alphaproteobacteria bacterium]|nr:M48 family metallopeptidase [Alphaproteobacteria bacterium]
MRVRGAGAKIGQHHSFIIRFPDMPNIQALRHPNESILGLIGMIYGGFIWFALLIGTFGGIFLVLLPVLFWLYVIQGLFRAIVLGSAVRVSERQFPHIHAMVAKAAADLGLKSVPDTFVVNSAGVVNAVAVRFLSQRYVLLYSQLVDLMDETQLRFVIGHELAHHAAGHLTLWRTALMGPARLVPLLGPAYSRACEYTADRISAVLTGDSASAAASLAVLACGSTRLMPSLDAADFRAQEAQVPPIFGLLSILFATHPRLTQRVIEVEKFGANPAARMAPAAAPAIVQRA